MKEVILRKSHAIIWFYIVMMIFSLAVSAIIDTDAIDFRSKEMYFVALRFILPIVLLGFVAYEVYSRINRKHFLVLNNELISDNIRGSGRRSWSEIDKIHFVSNFGIYQVHVYCKGHIKPIMLGPVKIDKDQAQYLKDNLRVHAIWS